VTTSVAGTLWTVVPLVAVMVSGYVPPGMDAAVLTVSTDDPAPAPITGGSKLQIA
jgi:hypothetical protein